MPISLLQLDPTLATAIRPKAAGWFHRMYGATLGYVGLKPPAIAPNVDFTLPAADGSNGQFLKTNGSGVLSFADVPENLTNAVILAPGATNRNVVQPTGLGIIPFTLKQVASPDSDSLQILNSSGTALAKIDKNGAVISVADNGGLARINNANTGVFFSGDGIGFRQNAGSFKYWFGNSTFFGLGANNLGWSGASDATTQDTGLGRNSAGIVEANNGTAGTFRDFKARSYYVTTNIQGTASFAPLLDFGVAGAGQLQISRIDTATNWLVSLGNDGSGGGVGVVTRSDGQFGFSNSGTSSGAIHNSDSKFTRGASGGIIAQTSAGITIVPFVAKGVASQSGSLQEWQNSTGTALSKIDNTGIGYFPSVIVNDTGISAAVEKLTVKNTTTTNARTAGFFGASAQGAFTNGLYIGFTGSTSNFRGLPTNTHYLIDDGGTARAVAVGSPNGSLSSIVLFGTDGTLTLTDGSNFVCGTSTGNKIGTAANQKIGHFGATPVTQRTKAGHNNWVSLSDVVNALVELGLFDQA
ncbi:MAG: hypothetical protein HY290_33545 [Planctomycetia bacterium]|nr:hypothetical protein [Planctomycetia bacterium]